MEQNTYPQPTMGSQPPMQQPPQFGMPRMKPQMGFVEAVKTCLIDKYCNFNGRARRSEFWWFVLAVFLFQNLLSLVLMPIIFKDLDLMTLASDPSAVTALLTSPAYLFILFVGLLLFLPQLGAQVRRLHDIGKSGHWLWFFLTAIIPILGFFIFIVFFVILIVWSARDGDPQPNKYGPSPKYY